METNTAEFSPQILRSVKDLQNFFKGKEEIAMIRRDAQNSPISSPSISRLQDRWSVCWLDIQSTGEQIYCCFLVAISWVLKGVGATDLAIRCHVHSRHQMTHSSLLSTFHKYRENFLVPSINTYRTDIGDFYLQPSLTNPFPRYSAQGTLNFYNQRGVCRGMCDWFFYLSSKTQGSFSSEEEHLKAVAKHFEKGASRQAGLLQTFNTQAAEDLLGFRFEEVRRMDPHRLSVREITNQINSLPQGAYAVYFTGHRINLIKEPNGQRYIFDPNRGLIKITHANQLEQVFAEGMKSSDNMHDILVDRVV